MAQTTVLKALADYFNAKNAPNHKPLREFSAELKALSKEEKQELAEGVCAVTGDTLA